MTLASMNWKRVTILLLFIFVFLLSYSFYCSYVAPHSSECPEKTPKQGNEVQNQISVIETTPPPKDTLVLIWNWPWEKRFALDKCAEFGFLGCKLSTDRSLYGTADAVIIQHAGIFHFKIAMPQEPRPYFQLWVWLNIEPPLIIRNLHMMDNLFNVTLTFRKDSDIFIPYGYMETMKEPQSVTIPKKSKLVAWAVSMWYPGVPRIAYYNELKKHITIDVYGAKHRPLSEKDLHPTISQYKFYLAFENSIYKDYITEKLWVNAFGSWAVPVVLGTSRENYEQYVPGDAFIHVNDFSTPKDLANYLLELDKDDVKYQKYFNWRSRYYVVAPAGWSYYYCKACADIKKSPKYQLAHNISNWFLKDV